VSFAGGDALAGEGGFATFSHELFHVQCRVGRLQFIPVSAAGADAWRHSPIDRQRMIPPSLPLDTG
jgi:hypothetical protein